MINVAVDSSVVLDVLQPGETAIVAVRGYITTHVIIARRHAIIVTDQRLICTRGRLLWKHVVEVPRIAIKSATLTRELTGATLEVVTGQGAVKIAVTRDAGAILHHALHDGQIPISAPAVVRMGLARTEVAHQLSTGARGATTAGGAVATTMQIEEMMTVIERLETDVSRLQQQVEFLEELLQNRPTIRT